MNKPQLFKKPRSLKNALTAYSAAMVIILLITAFSLINYFTGTLMDTTHNNVSETMALYTDQVSSSLELTRATLIRYLLDNTDVGLMSFEEDPSSLALDQIKVKELLDISLSGFSNTDGVFIYTKDTDCYVYDSKLAFDDCAEYMRKAARSGAAGDLALSNKWILRLFDNEYFLLNVIDLNNCYAGAWVKLDTLTTSFSRITTDTTFLYANNKGKVLSKQQSGAITLPKDTDSSSQMIMYSGKRYLEIVQKLDFCDYSLVALIPSTSIFNPIRQIAGVLAALLIITIILTIGQRYLTSSVFSKPAEAIQNASARISRNDLSTPFPENPDDFLELQYMSHSFNTLAGQITSLQKDIYEESLAKSEFELQYLKSQVAPHFLINCFSTIGSIPDTPEGKVIRQEMIRTLSDHLRYTLGRQKNVVLEDELYYVENYIKLSNIRFPDCLSYEINADENCMNAAVFPLLILMLTENSIKYNLVMGEHLRILITCRLATDPDGGKTLRIIHIDSGSGYPENQLETLNNMSNLGINPTADGHHIGIYNVAKRVRLMYGDKASIRFLNEPGMGARTEISIPYIPTDINEDDSL